MNIVVEFDVHVSSKNSIKILEKGYKISELVPHSKHDPRSIKKQDAKLPLRRPWDNGGSHLVRWEKVTLPLGHGSLGIGNIVISNKVLLSKWLWRFQTEPNCLWSKLITVQYTEHTLPDLFPLFANLEVTNLLGFISLSALIVLIIAPRLGRWV